MSGGLDTRNIRASRVATQTPEEEKMKDTEDMRRQTETEVLAEESLETCDTDSIEINMEENTLKNVTVVDTEHKTESVIIMKGEENTSQTDFLKLINTRRNPEEKLRKQEDNVNFWR